MSSLELCVEAAFDPVKRLTHALEYTGPVSQTSQRQNDGECTCLALRPGPRKDRFAKKILLARCAHFTDFTDSTSQCLIDLLPLKPGQSSLDCTLRSLLHAHARPRQSFSLLPGHSIGRGTLSFAITKDKYGIISCQELDCLPRNGLPCKVSAISVHESVMLSSSGLQSSSNRRPLVSTVLTALLHSLLATQSSTHLE